MTTHQLLTPLQKEDEILLISTARKVSEEEIGLCIASLEEWGLKVQLGKHIFKKDKQFAGTDHERAEDLQWALDHPSAKAILCTRGGYGSSRIIDSVTFNTFQKKPKWFIGFSDVSIIHHHINALGIASIHATMPLLFTDRTAVSSLKSCLFNDTYHICAPPHTLNTFGEAKGEVIGGNLTLVTHGLGTPSEIVTKDKILFLEEIDEYLYHLDRMIVQLKRAGKLKNLKGLIIGGLSKMNDNTIPFGLSAQEIIYEHTKEYNYPICFEMPCGHITKNHALIFEKKAFLKVNEEETKLSY